MRHPTNDFDAVLAAHQAVLRRRPPEILQLNLGRRCNLTCAHCHVNAGPHRPEIIDAATVDRILDWFAQTGIPTLDLTGGSPEMAPDFRRIVHTVRREFDRPRKVMDRLNATIFFEPGFEDLPEFFAEHEVEVIASMPCYSAENVNAQRGDGVFEKSIAAFQRLNALGYGRDPRLVLNFVYNPLRAALPPAQDELESDYRREMAEHFGIVFNHLYCLVNMPIARFASYLKRQNQLAEYMELLRGAFNPATVDGLMCRNTVNVSWRGEVFDCDFNQMLGLGLGRPGGNAPLRLWEVDPATLTEVPIRTGAHCFGCSAGAGSSCGGSLV